MRLKTSLLAGAMLALGLFAAGAASAQTTPAADAGLPFVLKPLGGGVYAAIDGPQGRSGSNAGFVIGDDGVLVVDSFFNPEATKALLAEIRKLTPLPVKYVVNTHYHIDHTGGDAVLKGAGAVIVAHRNVRGWLHPENVHLFGDRVTPALKAQAEALPEPDVVTDTGLTIWLGNRRVDVTAMPGHTGGDLVIRVPDAKVVFAGDLLWRRTSPNMIDGTTSKWIATDEAFEHLPDATAIRFVPGHGDVASVEDVADFAGYLAAVRQVVGEGMKAGLSGQALVDASMAKLKPRYGDWTIFERMAPREIGYMEAELKGTKRVPVPAAD